MESIKDKEKIDSLSFNNNNNNRIINFVNDLKKDRDITLEKISIGLTDQT